MSSPAPSNIVSQLIDLMYPSSSEEEGSIAVDSESEASIDYNDFDATSDDSDYEDSGSDSGSGSESLGDGMSDGSLSESSDNDSDATSSEEEGYFPAVVAPAVNVVAAVAPPAAPAAPEVPVAVGAAVVDDHVVPIAGGPVLRIDPAEAHLAAQGVAIFLARPGTAGMDLRTTGYEESFILSAMQWVEQHPHARMNTFSA